MGTRNLTVVQIDGDYKVAQYGQWDGYPNGQGATVLKFLKSWNRPRFEERLRAVKLLTSDDVKARWAEVGYTGGWVSLATSRELLERWPELSPDTGAKVLEMIQDRPPGIELYRDLEFSGDSLSCEFAYVIDMDQDALEVYRGFCATFDANGRFSAFRKEENGGYEPITIVCSYSFDSLPTVEKMAQDVYGEEGDG